MATQITNQATLDYSSGLDSFSVQSNTASVTLQGPFVTTKYSLENEYQLGEDITYNIFVQNTSAAALTNITVEDDLGTYAVTATANVTPLTYIGPAKLFINNVFSSNITGTVSAEGDSVTFVIPNLAAGSTALVQYEARVNEYAGAVVGTSALSNIASVTATGVTIPIVATNSIPVASYANVQITKAMSPDPVVDGSTLTYTFTILNTGTLDATDVVLTDLFTPAPTITSVTVDGTATTEYSYTNNVFRYPGAASTASYSIPAATFTQDPVTGVVTSTPGTSTISIQGAL